MAGIITPHFGFRPAAVEHSPSPLSFGFGLSPAASVPGWQPPGMQPSSFSPSPAAFASFHKSSQKRRLDESDGDELMERSPTPERRPVRPIKQMRVRPSESRLQEGVGDHDKASKESRSSRSDSGDDVDVGMLLASLPPQSLLPILTSLLSSHPSLKPTVTSLIPRPTLDTALNAVNQAAKKLVDEYPYSAAPPPFSNQFAAISFGFGSGAEGANYSSINSTYAFGRATMPSANHASRMRDAYILSRLRPLISNFVSTAFSYMPYFSFLPNISGSNPQESSYGREKIYPHPSETFAYLSALTHHLLNQPTLCQLSLAPLLLPRLLQEWLAWVNRVDEVLKQGGMIGSGIAETWIGALDRYAEASVEGVDDESIKYGLKNVRDRWITVAGWLVGRNTSYR